MADKIRITNSTLTGTFAIGPRAKSKSVGQRIDTDNSQRFERLKAELAGQGVSKSDIDALRRAVEKDETTSDVASQRFGPRVRAWMKGMLAKAVDAAWQVELGIASNILHGALQRYYGWP